MTNIGDIIRELPATKDEITNKLELSDHEFQKVRQQAKQEGINVFYDRSNKVYTTGVDMVNEENLEVAVHQYLSQKGMSSQEAKQFIQAIDSGRPINQRTTRIPFEESRVKYGVISDTHMGHKMYRADILEHAVENFRKEGVEFVVHAGDIMEGMSGREGHIYELTHLGATAQLDFAEKELQKITDEFPLYAIIANNSHDGWFNNKGNTGLDVGREFDRRLDDFHFLGHDEQDIQLDNGLTIRLRHPGGGTAYAISYKMQKYLLSMDDDDKPDIVHQGHYHKLNYLFYRNIHAFDAGALQQQSIFMKKKDSPSMLAYTIMDVGVDKQGNVDRVKPEFVTFK